MNNLLSMYQQFMANPMQMLARKYNLPNNLNDPNAIIQHLLNSGQVTQSQVNQAMQMRNNPVIQEIINKRHG